MPPSLRSQVQCAQSRAQTAFSCVLGGVLELHQTLFPHPKHRKKRSGHETIVRLTDEPSPHFFCRQTYITEQLLKHQKALLVGQILNLCQKPTRVKQSWVCTKKPSRAPRCTQPTQKMARKMAMAKCQLERRWSFPEILREC